MSEKTRQREPKFSAEVERQHRHINADAWENIYVVGDVHGCSHEPKKLLDKIPSQEDNLLVFVGDLIRKGPDSLSVIEKVKAMENAVSVRGNNGQKLLMERSEQNLETDATEE